MWVVVAASFVAALMGALASIGLGIFALGLVLYSAVLAHAWFQPERWTIVLLVALPYLVAPFSLGGFTVFLGMPLATVIGVSFLSRTRYAQGWRSPRLFAGLLLALLVPMILATIVSDDPLQGVSRIAYVLIFAVLAGGLGTAIASRRLQGRHVATALVAGAALAAIGLIGQSLLQFVVGAGRVDGWMRDLQPWFWGSSGGGLNWHTSSPDLMRAIFPFMSPAPAGQYMALGLVAGVWLLIDGARALPVRHRQLYAFAITLMTAALLLTFSRQSWVAAIIGVLVLLVVGRRSRLLIAAIPIVMIVAVLPTPGGDGSFYEYIADSSSSKSGEDRIFLWGQALDISAGNPIFGVGPGQYQELGDPSRPFYSHNMYLDQLVELGIAGGVLFLGYALVLLGAAWARRALLAFAMLFAYMIANIFDDSFYNPRLGLAMAVILGLIAFQPRSKPRPAPSQEPPWARHQPPIAPPERRDRILVRS